MKSTFLCIVTLLTCSGCAIGDLEFYPDYQRPEVSEEEWVKDQQLNPEFQHYLEEQRLPLYKQEPPGLPYLDIHREKEPDLTWPSEAAQNLFKSQNLARRISEITRKLEEPNRKPQYYFKTHGLNREQDNRFNVYNNLEDGDFVHRFKPNFHILDDVRLHPDTDTSDFSLPNDDLNIADNSIMDFSAPTEERSPQRVGEGRIGATKIEDKGGLRSNTKLVEQPTEFAYPPSDPRYFEDSPVDEVISSKSEENLVENNKSPNNLDSIQIQNRKDDGHYHQSLAGTRDVSRHLDDTLEVVAVKPHSADDTTGVYIIAIVAGISAAATVGLIAFGIGWYNLQKHVKNASDVEYPAYGVTGPNKDISPSGDRRLAQSAQMYHYQHQKQQIIAMERAAASERHGSVSEADSDEENEEGDYTVYECPGLAPTGEMEVKNPLFQDDPTPAQTPALKTSEDEVQKK